MKHLRPLLLLGVTASIFGCGSGISPAGDAGPPGRDAPPPPSDDGRWDDVGPAYHVEAGSVYVGSWIFDAQVRAFRRPTGCADTGNLEDSGNKRLDLSEFWLQAAPVTNLYYAICVERGTCEVPDHDIGDPNSLAWDNPARFELPAYTRYDQAEAYCQWAGGRLPTYAELLRAAQGAATMPGVRAMTEAAIACFAPGSTPTAEQKVLCGKMHLMNFATSPPNPLYRINGVDEDRGPFGHTDLFGSVFEWTVTMMNLPDARFCALADGSPDFVTFDTSTNVHFAVQHAGHLYDAIVGNRPSTAAAGVFQNNAARYYLGFRCAFDHRPD